MPGITHKSVWLYFYCNPSNKNVFVVGWRGERWGRKDANQQKPTNNLKKKAR